MLGAEYAESLVKFGVVQHNLSAGGQAENTHLEEDMQKAIEAFKEALKIYTLEKLPVEYAQTMNNLGIAYWELWAGAMVAKNENLQNAIFAYKEALKIYNAKDFSVEYAETQYNLELAYRELPGDFKMKKI
ncbi:MAG: tetratricopeptide repeat protein [Deltaproteobacteria bacterium]|nr:tetratricopeptide repeat protein [Deltaproteobacteria bacterium]